MSLLVFLLLFGLGPLAAGLALARVSRGRRVRRPMREVRHTGLPHPRAESERWAGVPDQPGAPAQPPSPPRVTVAWSEPLPDEEWSALVLARLQRLASLAPGGTDEFDAAELLRRVTYSTYLDCRELGLHVEARALKAHGSDPAGALDLHTPPPVPASPPFAGRAQATRACLVNRIPNLSARPVPNLVEDSPDTP